MDYKDLMYQYIRNGDQLSQNKVSLLNQHFKTIYISKRLFNISSNGGTLADYEIELLNSEQEVEYKNILNK